MVFALFKKKFKRASNENGQPRVVVIHNHIFKNAGSTVDWALHRNFGPAFVDHRDDNLMRQAQYLESYLRQNAHIQAMSTHHLTKPLPTPAGLELKELVMFRHPIERVVSVYNFERKQVIDIPGTVYARKSSLKDYIIWRMRPEVGATIRNFHVRKMLPPRKFGQERIEEVEMNGVLEQLMQQDLMGLVERFDESMVLFEDELRKFFPAIDLSYVVQNVGEERKQDLAAKLQELKQEIGEKTFELLLENNQRDLQLYERAKKEFDRRLSAMPAFNEKLSEFRGRCDKLKKKLGGRK